jgi:triosephosphate isomerase
MAAVVWAYYRNDKILAFRRSEVALTIFFFLLTMGLGFYCYCHLPLIDFLPYKIGVNIREEMHASSAAGPEGELQTVLVYRNRMTGEEREFALDDTEWQDDTVWEWVDTKILGEVPVMNPMIEEFALRNGAEDAPLPATHAPRAAPNDPRTCGRCGRNASHRSNRAVPE